jgi:hypothetical protein
LEEIKELAPIVLFVYDRPHHTERTLNALYNNELAKESILYIFSDGPKDTSDQQAVGKITEVREVIRKNQWAKEVKIVESTKNKGLALSIITAVSEIVKKHGNIIVLEDDIVVSSGFLKYMNNALDLYQEEERVMHISAYMYPHDQKLPESFFFEVPYPGGGWATWHRSWKYFKNDASYFYDYFEKNKKWNSFNKYGGKYLQKQLKANVLGELNTWFIKWHATMVLQNGLTLYPRQSLTNNIGFDNSGSHCSVMTKFDVNVLADKILLEQTRLEANRKAKRLIVKFYQGKYYPLKKILIQMTPEIVKPFLKKFL